MTRRAGQWELLGRSGDPVPADRVDVDAVADDFEMNGDVMTAASTALEQLANGEGWIGEAAKEFAGEADDTYGDLEKAASKYTDAAAALRTYAGHVETARDETAKALTEAETAHAAQLANQDSLLEDVDDPSDELKDADEDRQGRYDDAVSALSSARTRLDNAVETLDTHASTCANKISDASENFKDGRMDDIKGAVASVIKVLLTVLNAVAIVLAVVIIFIVVFTSLVVSPLLLAIALVVGIAIFALTVVQWKMGDATGEDVAWASLGLIGGGVGRLAGSSVRALSGGVRAALIVRSGRQAVRSLPLLVRFGRYVPIAPIRVWANGRRSTAVFAAMRQTMRTIDGTAVNPGLTALKLDGAVINFRSLNVMRDMDPGVINSIRLNLAHVANGGVLAGAGMELTAQVKDFRDLLGQIPDFPEDLGAMSDDVGDIFDGQPDRTIDVPPLPDPLPTHIAPAGR